MSQRFLTVLPVYNERQHVTGVLGQVLRFSTDVLVVDDGSDDGTAELLAARDDVRVITHAQNRGYGAALRTAFEYGIAEEYDVLVTIDCDGQHEPQRIPEFVEACGVHDDGPAAVDIVSGSRYLEEFPGDGAPPPERRNINMRITDEVNQQLGLQLTDAFCGFKAYRVAVLPQLLTTEEGYGMPLEVWVRAAHAGLHILELPVPLIYLEEKRSFGGALDEGQVRLEYYDCVIRRSLADLASAGDDDACKVACEESTG